MLCILRKYKLPALQLMTVVKSDYHDIKGVGTKEGQVRSRMRSVLDLSAIERHQRQPLNKTLINGDVARSAMHLGRISEWLISHTHTHTQPHSQAAHTHIMQATYTVLFKISTRAFAHAPSHACKQSATRNAPHAMHHAPRATRHAQRTTLNAPRATRHDPTKSSARYVRRALYPAMPNTRDPTAQHAHARPTPRARRHAQRSTRNSPRATLHAQRPTRNAPRATLHAPRATRNAQHATRNAQRATCHTQRARSHHTACYTQGATTRHAHDPTTRHSPRATRHSPRATRHAPPATRHPPRTTRHAQSSTTSRMQLK
jgi:hypothetical protein